jgi:uncharacterized protein YbjQ (UPF0145 family)
MQAPKEMLVVTTSSLEGITIKQYLKPVTAHVVTGINMFNDMFAGWTDIFGGRSGTYQRQLTSIYNEAVNRVKYAAHQIGANCILGLTIDIDEISGGNKSMLMITATGTAVIIERPTSSKSPQIEKEVKPQAVSLEQVNTEIKRRQLIKQAETGNLALNEGNWQFITANSLEDFLPYIIAKYPEARRQEEINPNLGKSFTKAFNSYLESLPDSKKKEIFYKLLITEHETDVLEIVNDFIKQWNLLDTEYIRTILSEKDFNITKRATRVTLSDKPNYDRSDIEDLASLRDQILKQFPERGQPTTKTGFLSSKEKPAWKCECGKVNEKDAYCSGCHKDVYGFKKSETSPLAAVEQIDYKISMIGSLIA